jgi:hypothetical protein
MKYYKNNSGILTEVVHSGKSCKTTTFEYGKCENTNEGKVGTYLSGYIDDDYDGNVFGATMGVGGLKKNIRDTYFRSISTK